MQTSPSHQRVAAAYRNALTHEREVGFGELPSNEKELVATVLMHEEIRNGGFLQWFTNPHSDFASYAVQFLRRIGAYNRLHLVEVACAQFPDRRIPPTQAERWACVSEWTTDRINNLSAIDQQYYGLNGDLYDDMLVLLRDPVS
jgi:hypothetical protein